jgi:hypothetical protein
MGGNRGPALRSFSEVGEGEKYIITPTLPSPLKGEGLVLTPLTERGIKNLSSTYLFAILFYPPGLIRLQKQVMGYW